VLKEDIVLIHTCRQLVKVVVTVGAIAAFGVLGEGLAQASKKSGEELKAHEGGEGGDGSGGGTSIPGGLPSARERDAAPPAMQRPGEQRPLMGTICGPGTSDPNCELSKKLQNK
jgi:hypothetical protein